MAGCNADKQLLKKVLFEFLIDDAFMQVEDYPDWKNWHDMNEECQHYAETMGFYNQFTDEQKKVLYKGANYCVWEIRCGNSELAPIDLTKFMNPLMSVKEMEECLKMLVTQYESKLINR